MEDLIDTNREYTNYILGVLTQDQLETVIKFAKFYHINDGVRAEDILETDYFTTLYILQRDYIGGLEKFIDDVWVCL